MLRLKELIFFYKNFNFWKHKKQKKIKEKSNWAILNTLSGCAALVGANQSGV
jgi:hypothetical protein